MKRKGDPKAPKRVKITWDEGNLSENERIKAELCPTRIDEPKTPFHSPPREADEDPFEEHCYEPADASTKADIDEDEELHQATDRADHSGVKEHVTEATVEEADDNAGASGTVAASDKMTYWEDSPGRIKVVTDKDPVFTTSRKEHYDMRDALRRGKELLENDDDDDGKEGGENEAGASRTDGVQPEAKCE